MNAYQKCHMYELITVFFDAREFNQMKTLILQCNNQIVNPVLAKQCQKNVMKYVKFEN